MRHARLDVGHDPGTPPRIPSWIPSGGVQTIEDASFYSGAALAHLLHGVLVRGDVPSLVLCDRLALRAAEACVVFSGRPERAGELRDALHLLRPGDLPGPAGAVYQAWHRAVERPVSTKALHRALPAFDEGRIAAWRKAGTGAPVTRAAMVLEAVLAAVPRRISAALILAEAALAQALRQDRVMPLLTAGLKRADLRKRGADLRLACHRAVTAGAVEAVHQATDLARRAARLEAVGPSLRTKGAGDAVQMFLSRDAMAPSALPLPDRSARRLCDRLVALGAVRELTGRDSFRLYGL